MQRRPTGPSGITAVVPVTGPRRLRFRWHDRDRVRSSVGGRLGIRRPERGGGSRERRLRGPTGAGRGPPFRRRPRRRVPVLLGRADAGHRAVHGRCARVQRPVARVRRHRSRALRVQTGVCAHGTGSWFSARGGGSNDVFTGTRIGRKRKRRTIQHGVLDLNPLVLTYENRIRFEKRFFRIGHASALKKSFRTDTYDV